MAYFCARLRRGVGTVIVVLFALVLMSGIVFAQATPPLNFGNNFFVTGDYAVGGVGLVGQANKIYPGYAVGTISMGADTNPGVKGANNSVPAGAEIVAALVYWQTIEQIGGATGQNGFFRPLFSGGPATGYQMPGTPLPNPNGTVYWDGTGCATGSSTPKQLVTYVAVVTPYLQQDAQGNVLAGNTTNPKKYEVQLPSQSNGAPLTLGATLVIIYRVMSPDFPLNSIVIYDGTYSPSSSLLTTTNTIQGFYQSDGSKSKLTYIVGNGQKNQSETVTLNGSSPLPSFYGASQPPFPGYYSGGQWDTVTWTFPNASVTPKNPVPAGSSSATMSWPSQSVSTVVTSAKAECVTPVAVIFSTRVSDPDHDGLPPVLKNSRGYCDPAMNNGSCNFGSATDPGYVPLDDPTDHPQVGRKDVFVQLDYMVDASDNPLLSYNAANDSTTPPQPIASAGGNVNLGVTRLQNALLGYAENLGRNDTHNVHLHVFAGNALQNYSGAITEQSCTDGQGLCSFPSPPGDAGGYVGWKGNFSGIKNQLVLNGDPTQCTSTPPPAGCQPRFQHGKKDSYHYLMLGRAPGLAQWFMGGGIQNAQQSGNVVTFTTSTSHGPLDAIGIVYPTSGGGLTTIDPATGLPTGLTPPTDPSCGNGRVTITGAATNPNLNGTYCIQNSTDTTFTVNIGGSAANTTYTLATDPNLAVAPGYVTTVSGVSDEGGEDSLITLASWGPRATEKVIGGTIMHETGHSNGLTHGGFLFPNAGSGDYTPAVETNCKPNFQSVMSYTRQFDLLQYLTGYNVVLGVNFPLLIDVVDYSEESLNDLVETKAGVANVFPSAPFYFNTTWYRPTSDTGVGGTPSLTHCDGTPITDGAQYSLLTGPANLNPPLCPFCNAALSWLTGEDINFDGTTDASTLNPETLKGYKDWDHISFDQVGATGSLSSTGGGLIARGGGLIARGGGLIAQGGSLDSLGGGLVARGGGLVARGGGLIARGGGLIARGSAEPSLYTGDSAVHPPTQLFATEAVSPRNISLTWTKPTGITVVDRYNIYRMPAFASGSPLTVQASLLSCSATQCTYVDTTATCNPAGYTYAVSALQQGTTNESVKSNSVNTTTTGKLLTGCYTNTPPTVLLNSPMVNNGVSAVTQGPPPVPVTWSLQDDDTGVNVSRLQANSVKLYGPINNDVSCGSVTNSTPLTQLLTNGVVNPSYGGTTFGVSGNFFTLNWDDTAFPAGCYVFEVDLDSGQSAPRSSPLTVLIYVSDTGPYVTTTILPKAIAGVPYNNTIDQAGGVGPSFTWAITAGATPPGIKLAPSGDSSTGADTLSGTATDVGTYNFTVQVTDNNGNYGTRALSLLVVAPVAQINQPLAPETLLLGGAAPMLTVNGEGFYSGSKVLWNGNPLITTFVNTGQLTATVPAADVASLGTASINVANKTSPNSNVDFFQVSDPIAAVSLSRSDETIGVNPNAVIAADFNGDGKLDLAIANSGDNTVSILLGNGDGTFMVSATPATGNAPHSLAAGDFNGDGKLDLLVTNFNDGNVSVFLGNGDGTFQTPVTYAVGNAPASVITADFDRDGKLDLAVANQSDHTVSILLGKGDGTFQPKVDYAAGTTDVGGLAVGDFNRDNKLDLAVTNPSSDTVSVLLGNGDGTFQAAVPYVTGSAGDDPVALSAVDVNGDGILDLAVSNLNGKTVAILKGNGDGTFQTKLTYSTTTGASIGPDAIATGDFNADGKLDLAITNQGDNTIAILLGNGDGTFQNPQETTTGSGPASVVAGDFIGNGRLDLAVTDYSANAVSILLQRPQPAANLMAGVTVGQATLSWTASVSTTVTGYNVYRSTTSGGGNTGYTKIASLGKVTSYTDATVSPGTTYYYVVTAVDPHNLESVNSNEGSVTVPQVPTNLTATAGTGQVTLSWNVTAGVTYNVYRGTMTGGPYAQIASQVSTIGYVDHVTSGITYYYVVTAVASNAESAYSNEASATP